jgi:hypothetical protein
MGLMGAIMSGTTIWLVAIALYGLFRAWYDNWRGPLTRGEIDHFMALAQARSETSGGGKTDLSIFRKFLEEDDGREFFMVNLVKIVPGQVADPDSGAMMSGAKMLSRYSNPFVKRLIGHGGHPALVSRKVAGYVDSWNVPPDPGWTILGFMRYRSRRDLAKLAFDPTFDGIHKYKLLGIEATYSFPSQPSVMLLVGPRIWVGLTLALVAALANLAAI